MCGGVGSVARCVDCVMIWAASFSVADGHVRSGQGDVACVAQFNLAVSIRFKVRVTISAIVE
jgi:acetamidase/formamidase